MLRLLLQLREPPPLVSLQPGAPSGDPPVAATAAGAAATMAPFRQPDGWLYSAVTSCCMAPSARAVPKLLHAEKAYAVFFLASVPVHAVNQGRQQERGVAR